MTEGGKSAARTLLETVGGLVAIAGVLLPVIGLAARFTAFDAGLRFDPDSRWPIVLATSASIAELAVWGFIATVIALAVVGLFYFFAALLALPRVKAQAPPSRRLTRTIRIVGLILMVGFLVVTPSFPVYWIVIPTAIVTSLVIRRSLAEGRRLRVLESWWVFAAFLVVSGLLLGLTGVVPSQAVADYRFRDEVHGLVADGKYDQIGEANGFVYLSRCGSGGQVVVVKEEEILTAKPTDLNAHTSGPSLFDILSHHRPISLGYEPC